MSRAVEALRHQDYPPGLLDVIVIADNCSDGTAAAASVAGAVVWERADPDAPGKGRALTWALDRLWRELPSHRRRARRRCGLPGVTQPVLHGGGHDARLRG